MKKLLIIFILLFSFNAYALEVTDFRVSSPTGPGLNFIYFIVTVALDDLESQEEVTCIIYKNDKPIAKGSANIDGVETIKIRYSVFLADMKILDARCKLSK